MQRFREHTATRNIPQDRHLTEFSMETFFVEIYQAESVRQNCFCPVPTPPHTTQDDARTGTRESTYQNNITQGI